jgi:hypothetical protein
VNVAEEAYFSFFLKQFDQSFSIMDSRMEEFVRFGPSPVEIYPQQGASVVTIYYSVRIQHGYNFKDEMFP